MSPDEIFAAHMWPWPDPLLKRDLMGRIIFVNAAFLQLYGGRVEDWSGNTVGGWPNPQGPNPQGTAQPTRFETRVASHKGERVYDWIEQVMADSTAIAIARDVTDLLTPIDTPPGQSAEAPQQTQALEASHQEPHVQDVQHLTEVVAEQAQLQAQAQAPVQPHMQTPIEAVAPQQIEAPAEDVPNLQPTPAEALAAEPAPETGQAPTLAETPIHTQDVAEPVQEPPKRDHERRALPIENGDAVLGNNWRDAVIAKAVGATVNEEVKVETPEIVTAPKTSSEAGRTTADLRILLAEDNAINALLTRTLLEAEGSTVDVVEDGVLAVEAMKNASYDMIFMDMRMPNMDGLESTRKIRELPNVPSDLPIVALTANAFDDDRNACFDSGMNDFMTKPVSAEELSEMVTRWALKPDAQKLAS